MNYAIRSGISITAGYAIRQSTRLLRTVKGHEREEITSLQQRLESKIRIVSPAIDMIELISARGNTSLDSAVSLTKTIRLDIQTLGLRLARAATDEELLRRDNSSAKSQADVDAELKAIIVDMKRLLNRIEDAVPLINLAITTSGVNLSTQLPATVSPSRLLQASTFLTAGDTRYAMSPRHAVQIGPIFVLSLYMLFAGHSNRPHDEEGIRETTWKEVIHKARVKLLRVPLESLYTLPIIDADDLQQTVTNVSHPTEDDYFPPSVPSEGKAYEFAYQLLVIEDLDDDRVHSFDDDEPKPERFEDVALAGIREVVPIHEISKIFYADTSKILNISTDGETNNPILLLKRDVNAVPPRRMAETNKEEHELCEEKNGYMDSSKDGVKSQLPRETTDWRQQHSAGKEFDLWRLPQDLDPEWLAFEVYTEEPDNEEDDEVESTLDAPSPSGSVPAVRTGSLGPMTSALSYLHLYGSPPTQPPKSETPQAIGSNQIVSVPLESSAVPLMSSNSPTTLPPLRTSLSLLEVLIRLTALQQFQQASHLTISDELLNFFLSEAGTTGAGADTEYRKRARDHARRRVGFDPYDESPIKRRGEEYLDHYTEDHQGWESDELYKHGDRNAYHPEESRRGSPDVDWRYGSQPRSLRNSTRQSPTSYLNVSSPPPMSSPSPSLRHSVQERTAKINSTSEVHRGRDSGFVGTSTPPPVPPKGRPEALRREVAAGKRSALSRSESDSTLGTSPTVDGQVESSPSDFAG